MKPEITNEMQGFFLFCALCALFAIIYCYYKYLRFAGYSTIEVIHGEWEVESPFGSFTEKAIYEIMVNKKNKVIIRTSGYEPKRHRNIIAATNRANKIREQLKYKK